MTIKEAKAKYGRDDDGYVSCCSCPLNNSDDCEKYAPSCNGYADAWNAIRMATTHDDAVNHPKHYTQGGIECIDAMVAAFGEDVVADYCIVNAFKYIWRYKHKNGNEDIDKAHWYINKYKALKEGVPNEEH